MHPELRVIVGSKNKAKVDAVREILAEYPHLAHAMIEVVESKSEVNEQPKSLEETVRGAMNRAKNSFNNCIYSIGLESGLVEVPGSKSGYMDLCACAIYDGREYHLGLSSAWEFPDREISKSIMEGTMTMSEAIVKAGMTNKENIGSEEGAIGILTKGRLDRKEYTKQSLRTALIHLEQFNF